MHLRRRTRRPFVGPLGCNISEFARKTGLQRPTIYRAFLSNEKLSNFTTLLVVLSYRLAAQSRSPAPTPVASARLFLRLEKLWRGMRCSRGVLLPWLGGEASASSAFLPVTSTPTKPATTKDAPAIISQCGNWNASLLQSQPIHGGLSP